MSRPKLREENPEAHLIAYNRADRAAARESRYRIVSISDPEGLKQALAETLGVLVVVEKVRRLLLWRMSASTSTRFATWALSSRLRQWLTRSRSDVERHHASELEEALAITSDRIVAFSYSDELLSASSGATNGLAPGGLAEPQLR